MSYSIKKSGSKFCVYDEAGKKLGEHDTRADAMNQMRKLYREEGSKKNDPKAKEEANKSEAEGDSDYDD